MTIGASATQKSYSVDPRRSELEAELSHLKDEHRIAKNRIAVLENDLAVLQTERSKTDELSAGIARGFSLVVGSTIAHANGTFPFEIASPRFANSLCQMPHVSATVQIDWSPGVDWRLPSSRQLVVGCPRGRNWPLVAHLPAVSGTYKVCPRLELFNVVESDLGRSFERFGQSGAQNDTTIGGPQPNTCTSLSVYVGRSIGCVNVTVPSAEQRLTPGQAAGAACTYTTSEVQGRWSESYQRGKPAQFEQNCLRQTPPAAVAASPPWRWVHLIGDSVFNGLLGLPIAKTVYGGSLSLMKRGSEKWDSLPQYGCLGRSRFNSTRLGVQCFTTSRWFDSGSPYAKINFDSQNATEVQLFEKLREAGYAGKPRPDIVLLSMGSHHRDVWGEDEDAHRRFLSQFRAFVRRMRRHGTRGFMLATETARETAFTPSSYAAVEVMCRLSNLRLQLRNRAMAEAFLRACAENEGAVCRILDLFSPTIALVGAPANFNFRDRDPIHFWRHKDAAAGSGYHNFVGPMAAGVIASVLQGMASNTAGGS